jgi:DNA-binding GntR family transcriptional regulator
MLSADTYTERDATARAVRALREMVMSRRIGPGQQLRQDELAEEMGLSRSPLREALRMLETEGLLVHMPNQGYFVARLRSAELKQIYLMRRLLETELLRTLRRPSTGDLSALRAENERMRKSVASGRLTEVLQDNRSLHFGIFILSPLELVTRQVERLWNLSESYRAAYLWLPAARERIIAEHSLMIDALEAGDVEELVALADSHRSAAEASVIGLLLGEEGEPMEESRRE